MLLRGHAGSMVALCRAPAHAVQPPEEEGRTAHTPLSGTRGSVPSRTMLVKAFAITAQPLLHYAGMTHPRNLLRLAGGKMSPAPEPPEAGMGKGLDTASRDSRGTQT